MAPTNPRAISDEELFEELKTQRYVQELIDRELPGVKRTWEATKGTARSIGR